MAFSWSAIFRSKAFFESSVVSNCVAQYSFLASSSTCSFFNTAIMSSTILMTLSKPPWFKAFLPVSVSTKKSREERWSRGAFACAFDKMSTARARVFATPEDTCIKLELAAPGNVFLKRSKASSSLRILMVSDNATNSSARVFFRSSHSAVFVPQLVFNSARNFLSASRVAPASPSSSFISTISKPISPICVVFASIVAERASTSLAFAATSSSCALTAACSEAVASARSLDMVSCICFRIPTISPLEGAYSEEPERKETNSWRSASTRTSELP
mmetsp:Transcript_8806/g.25251  ORF Transcript_8806/g.25251 Transcript_8806/m.25251 type:complete len:274 (-) Transcript_8806:565-1386(-)